MVEMLHSTETGLCVAKQYKSIFSGINGLLSNCYCRSGCSTILCLLPKVKRETWKRLMEAEGCQTVLGPEESGVERSNLKS